MNQDFIEVYEYLEKNYPQLALDIYYSLELFVNTLDSSIEVLGKTGENNLITRDFSMLTEIAKYGKIITDIREQINEYLNNFVQSELIDETIDAKEDDEKSLPNYKEYIVDDEIPHTLMESFTHKKICGFMLKDIRYNVSTWQKALISLCELLVEQDIGLFETFTSSPLFVGRKNRYFSKDGFGNKYYYKLSNANIYVWLNLSVSMICEIMKKILRCYSIPINSLYIYLRADYTSLHIIDCENEINIADEQNKIGKFVRSTMRQLSNENYVFSDDMMKKLTDKEQTKKIFGIGIPFFKELINEKDISVQIKDSNNRNRYWKEVFIFNGKKFLITSQWFDYNRERFNKWYNELRK